MNTNDPLEDVTPLLYSPSFAPADQLEAPVVDR